MPQFQCRLASEDGRIIAQSFFAPSFQECRKYFEEKGYCVLTVKRDWKKLQIQRLPFQKKIKEKDFLMFNQELIALVKAGYPILRSMEIIISRSKNVYLKELLMKVEEQVRAGKALSEAFIPYEKQFSKIYTASLMAGERSGNLAGTIKRFVEYEKIIVKTKSRIKSALAYPTLLICFAFVLMGILINFIIPRFSEFYADFDAQLPMLTRALMTVSLTLRDNFLIIAGIIVLLIILYFRMLRTDKGRILLDKYKLKIPYGRAIWVDSAISLFCRTLELLLDGGITLLTSVGIASQAVPNRYFVKRMEGLPANIKSGESLSASLKHASFFTPLSLDMIRIGETSANLEGMLSEVADVYDERIQSRIDTLVTLVEPVIIILMGLVIAAMLLSVYLPIFNIIRVAQ